MLPTLVDVAPDGGEWIHEIKYDGYRTQLALARKVAQAFRRNGHDCTEKYGLVVAAAQALRCRSAIIDGEICVQSAAEVTDFKALRSAIRSTPERLVLFAFDLLMLEDRDFRAEPLVDLRHRLRDLIGADATTRIAFSGEHVGEGPMFYQAADQHGLEGIMSKRADSLYVSGRARSWLKVNSLTWANASRTTPGAGLGLALVTAIAELHDAELKLSGSSSRLSRRDPLRRMSTSHGLTGRQTARQGRPQTNLICSRQT